MATHETPQHFTNGTFKGRIAFNGHSFIVHTVCGKEIPCRRINDALSLLQSPFKAVSPSEMPLKWQLQFVK